MLMSGILQLSIALILHDLSVYSGGLLVDDGTRQTRWAA